MAIRATPNHFTKRKRQPVRQGPTQLVLEIVRGRVKQRLRKVRAPVFLLGGAADCDLVLGDQQFPDAYAYIFQRSDGVSVRHLGGGPGLEVDGLAVETAPLKVGSRITAGPFEFVLTNDRGDRGDEDDTHPAILRMPRNDEYVDAEGVDAVQALLREIRRKTAQDMTRGTGLARLGIVRRASA